MELLKPIAICIKDLSKLADTSRNALQALIRSPQNPAGRLIVGKPYDVYGITETQARSWSFLVVSETLEMVWVDMEYCLYADPSSVATWQTKTEEITADPVPVVATVPSFDDSEEEGEADFNDTYEAPPVKRGRKPKLAD